MASPPFTSINPASGQRSPSHTSPDRMQDIASNGSLAPSTTVAATPPAVPSITGASKLFPSSPTTFPKARTLESSLLTGIRQAAAGNTSTHPPALAEINKDGVQTSANPAEVLKAGHPVSRPEDGPTQASNSLSSFSQPSINTQATVTTDKPEGKHPALGGLPSIATAASAMQIDTDTSSMNPARGGNIASDGNVTAGPVGSSPETPDSAKYLADAMQAYMLHTPLSAHPMSADTPTTPGFPLSATTPTTPYTTSSLHTPLTPGGGRSKHTCTHCNQTFTRHHNLKSHLLTHSHEKPFPCTQCTARFRRLHDLKRHSKLHTGERPHVCEKCGRRFARGDALARHARGEGGCAGRRSSLGGLLDGDTKMYGDGTGTDGDDDGMMDEDTQMEGSSDTVAPNTELGSTGVAPDTPSSAPSITSSSSGARRPASLPSIKTNVADNNHLHPHHQPHIQQIHQLQSFGTYPPMTPARSAASTGPSPGGSLFPPTPNHGKTTPISATSSPNINSRRGTSPMSGVTSNPNQSILGTGGMTESPRPLSPAQQTDAVARTKSPLGQFHSAGAKYAPPMTPQSAQPQNAPAGFVSSAPTSHAAQPRQPPSSQQQSQTQSSTTQPGQSAAPQAPMGFPPKGNPPAGGGGENPNLFENERGVWDYIKELERRVAELEAKQKGCDAFIAQAHQQSLAVAAVAAARAGSAAAGTMVGAGNVNTPENGTTTS